MGGSLENFILARNVQSRSKSRIFLIFGPSGSFVKLKSSKASTAIRTVLGPAIRIARLKSLRTTLSFFSLVFVFPWCFSCLGLFECFLFISRVLEVVPRKRRTVQRRFESLRIANRNSRHLTLFFFSFILWFHQGNPQNKQGFSFPAEPTTSLERTEKTPK